MNNAEYWPDFGDTVRHPLGPGKVYGGRVEGGTMYIIVLVTCMAGEKRLFAVRENVMDREGHRNWSAPLGEPVDLS